MKTEGRIRNVLRMLAAFGVLMPGSGPAQASPVDAALSNADQDRVWVTWQVPMRAGQGSPCCWSGHWRHPRNGERMCALSKENHFWGQLRSSDGPVRDSTTLTVYARQTGGVLDRILSVGDDCRVDADGVSLIPLHAVSPEHSLAFLSRAVRQAPEDPANDAIAAIGLHAGQRAVRTLVDLDGALGDADRRRQVLFWLGTTADETGYRHLRRVALDDGNPEIRQGAVFALAQHGSSAALDTVVEVSHDDPDGEVRGQALFWLADAGDPRALPAIRDALEHDRDDDVRNQALLALSELPDGQGIEDLVAAARRHPAPEVRGQALFWLAQTGYEGAARLILDVLDEEGDEDVRSQAVFAAAELPDGRSVELLARLLREHPDPRVKRDALFWLGQSEDPRALQALDDILNP